jgi:hypothetical protein
MHTCAACDFSVFLFFFAKIAFFTFVAAFDTTATRQPHFHPFIRHTSLALKVRSCVFAGLIRPVCSACIRLGPHPPRPRRLCRQQSILVGGPKCSKSPKCRNAIKTRWRSGPVGSLMDWVGGGSMPVTSIST